jgi:uncharacterized membrane protein YhdT
VTCERCGATLEDGAFCKHCGARVLRPKDVGADTDHRTAPERFELAEKAQGYNLARAHTPKVSAKADVIVPIIVAAFGVFFLIGSQAAMSGDSHAPAWFRAAFVVVPVIFIVTALVLLRKGMTFAAAPVTNELLVVVDERVSVTGRGDNSSASTTYYATLQDRSGSRTEYETYDWLAGRIAAGDIGVAYLKGRRLVDFARLDIR